MTTDPRRREVYMHVSALPKTRIQSPEEIRIEDYLEAYSTTGRPPVPIPQEPSGETERVALGLPPLFQPHIEATLGAASTTPSPPPVKSSDSFTFGAAISITEPSQLPNIHAFQPLAVNDGETYHNIAAMPQYQYFSQEELRCYAYISGVIFPPAPLPTNLAPIPIPQLSGLSPSVHPFFAKDSSTTAFFEEPNQFGQGSLYYHTISAGRRFDKHSPEELHVAFLQAGREVESSQIPPPPALGMAPSPSGTSVSPLFGAAGGAFAQPPAVRQF